MDALSKLKSKKLEIVPFYVKNSFSYIITLYSPFPKEIYQNFNLFGQILLEMIF
jgi:hypothetical protein